MSDRPLRLVRAVGADCGDAELEVFDTRDGYLYRYFGSGTVWYRAEDGRRAGSSVERELCDLWSLARYLHSKGKLQPDGSPSPEYTGFPIRAPDAGMLREALSELVGRLRELEPSLSRPGGVYRGADPSAALSDALRGAEAALERTKPRDPTPIPRPPPEELIPPPLPGRPSGRLGRAALLASLALAGAGGVLALLVLLFGA